MRTNGVDTEAARTTPPAVLDLEALEVRLALHDLEERLDGHGWMGADGRGGQGGMG